MFFSLSHSLSVLSEFPLFSASIARELVRSFGGATIFRFFTASGSLHGFLLIWRGCHLLSLNLFSSGWDFFCAFSPRPRGERDCRACWEGSFGFFPIALGTSAARFVLGCSVQIAGRELVLKGKSHPQHKQVHMDLACFL